MSGARGLNFQEGPGTGQALISPAPAPTVFEESGQGLRPAGA